MMTNPEIYFIDHETSEKVVLNGITTSSFSCETDEPPVNIHNSYHFECNLKMDDEARKLLYGDSAWKTACQIADRLNDLIEEYHAPGTPRRERRAIQREFDRIFKIYLKHCKANNIQIGFTKLDK